MQALSCPTPCDLMGCMAHQASLSVGLSRQEYWSGLLFPPPGDLSSPEITPMVPAVAGGFSTTEPPGKLSWETGV